MTSFWGMNGSPKNELSTEPWSRVDLGPNKPNQKLANVVAGPSCLTKFSQKHLTNQFNDWNGLNPRQSPFTGGQRSAAKRHRTTPGDGEPIMKKLLSERMAAGMRKLQITDDDSEPYLESNGLSLWDGSGRHQENATWKQNLDERLDTDSDESGCEEDQPQLIIEQDLLKALKSQNTQSSLPPQILTNIRESNMQLVLWKPVPFPGLCDDKTREGDDISINRTDGKLNAADDNMADSPVDEDMDL